MEKRVFRKRTIGVTILWMIMIVLTACSHPNGNDRLGVPSNTPAGDLWTRTGRLAGEIAFDMVVSAGGRPQRGDWVVMTNAGFSEINAATTEGALDGLASSTAASRGSNTLVEVHAAPWVPLWFALYDTGSGLCSYLEVDAAVAGKSVSTGEPISETIFKTKAMERIDAAHLFAHASVCSDRLAAKPFGGNEFRIVTIANAVAQSAPVYAVRAFEFHDHYCPGVTSGILLANYLKRHFPAVGGGYFVHSVTPWCKEDALLVMLNATPGKRSYAVEYPSETDSASRPEDLQTACTIVYRRNGTNERWEGVILAFRRIETGCPQTGSTLIDKLCADLWYLQRMDAPEDFVQVIRTFTLDEGVSPRDLARPGIDPLKELTRMP